MIQSSEILITGGYGFIGANLAQRLADPELGNQVTVMDILTAEGTTGHDLSLADHENIEVINGNVLDPESFGNLPRSFEHVIHTAGFLGIKDVAANQALTLDTNILSVRHCLDFAAAHTEKPSVVVFSTSEIYGIQCAGPAENEPAIIPTDGARWCYATAKLAGEYYLRAYNQQYGVPGGIIRPFNVFGPYRYGSNAVTALVNRAVNNQDLEISGDGRQIRAWCYIDDFCDGAIRVAEHGQSSDTIEAFNVGDDNNVLTMATLAESIVQLTDSDSKVVIMNDEVEDVFYRIPDLDKARNLLGYEPGADFEQSLMSVIDWVRS